jgi:hypothetical protein
MMRAPDAFMRRLPEPFGPVLAAARDRLLALNMPTTLSISERSPFGRRAVRIRADQACPQAARDGVERLAREPWVAAAVATPPNIYLLVEDCALEAWVMSQPVFRPPSASLSAELTYPDPAALSAAPLELMRQAAVGWALATLLRSRGVDVTERHAASASNKAFQAAGRIGLRLGVDGALTEIAVEVAGVDVPQGALRARHGGVLHVADLLSELRRVAPAPSSGLARFLMLRCERGQRLRIDETRLSADAEIFEEWEGAHGAQPTRALRSAERADLILGLEALTGAGHRALEALDPHGLCRHLRGLLLIGAARLPKTDPLRPRAMEILDEAACSLALTAAQVAQARSGGRANWQNDGDRHAAAAP